MSTPTQLGHVLFRILLYRNDAAEILLETTSEGFRLPVLCVPAHRREAEEITGAIRTSWNLETYGLFRLPAAVSAHPFVHDYVVESCQADTDGPLGMEWLSMGSLSVEAFQTRSDFAAIQNSLLILDQYRGNELPGPFGKPGWLRTLTDWVDRQASAAGLHLTGAVRQLNASPTFSLIRFATDGPALWFKAVGEPNVHEHRVTIKLAAAFPKFLPDILASRPEWNAWLSVESKGSPLGECSSETAWAGVAETLALLQISSFGRRFELIEAGCRDLRPCMLLDLADPFFDSMTQLMKRQTKISPATLSRCELLALGREITSALGELEDAGIPNTLGHLDLNPGNILVSPTRCVFLDWQAAYIGPPFPSFQYLLEHWHRFRGEDSRHEESLVRSYLKHWVRFASTSQIASLCRIAPLLAAFMYALSIPHSINPENINQQTAGYLRSLSRRMMREVRALGERKALCIT